MILRDMPINYNSMRIYFFSILLFSLACTSNAYSAMHEECIVEPIFKGRVCTLETNSKAKIGVLLIHGIAGSISDWKKTIPSLAKDFHVVAFDLPGFGKSDKGNQYYSPTLYANLARFLADHYFENKTYYVVGHSMGGAVALRLASQQPLRFKRLVLIDAAGILHPQVITKFQAGSMIERASGVSLVRGFAERLSGKLLEQADRLPISPADIVNTAIGRDYVLQGGPLQIAALALAGEDFGHAIDSVSEPTLILWGDHDLVAPLRTGYVLARRLQNANLEIINGAGHEPMQDQTLRVNSLLKTFLLANDDALQKSSGEEQDQTVLNSDRVGTCSHDSGMEFVGDYRAIELDDCNNINIRNARIGQLTLRNSRVNLIDTDIFGKEVGIFANNSELTITNGEISGAIAISAVNSRLDLAGVHLRGDQAAVKGVGSKLILSVCQVSSQHSYGNMHTYKNMVDEEL